MGPIQYALPGEVAPSGSPLVMDYASIVLYGEKK